MPARNLIRALPLTVLLAACADASVPATVAEGNPVYDQHCISCHGPDARGIDNQGVDLAGSAFVKRASATELAEFLKVGRFPDDTASLTGRPMPGFGWLADGELQSVAEFLKAISGGG